MRDWQFFTLFRALTIFHSKESTYVKLRRKYRRKLVDQVIILDEAQNLCLQLKGKVCEKMFPDTLNITDTIAITALRKKNGMENCDKEELQPTFLSTKEWKIDDVCAGHENLKNKLTTEEIKQNN